MLDSYDIIVVGAGHAGCEAAYSAAKMGSSVLLLTMDMNKIAQMSCNPAMGGIAKGQIIREIDALGGYTGLITDASTIQFRMLNRSKGPAMWSPRAQCDRQHFSLNWRFLLENTPNLNLWQDTVVRFLFDDNKVTGVETSMGAKFYSKSVILTAGTFLNGKLFIGQNNSVGGRIGELPSLDLSEQLFSVGFKVDRMKTGTPPRIDVRSIDLKKLQIQEGDSFPEKFSFLNVPSPIQAGVNQMCCFMVHTNETVHNTLREGFEFSPLFSGKISGLGPRYCPSIEDKLRTFAGKDSHQLFLEPEGWNTNEYYLQGFSSSLPLDVQYKALRAIPGFERVVIFRPAYAVEYDYFPPTQLNHTLETKLIENLYFAGQINGTTGYEEAGAQGLMAGINAHLKINGKEPLVLKRDQAYIGVLIDDLVTKGVDEPYRMFTSRAEYRILLRQDNADLRLTGIGYNIGLASEERYDLMVNKYNSVDNMVSYLSNTSILPEQINGYLAGKHSSIISSKKKLAEILTRPQTNLKDILEYVPRETYLIERSVPKSIIRLLYQPDVTVVSGFAGLLLSNEVIESAEIRIKYSGYIDREKRIADKILRLEEVLIPENFDYASLKSLSTESRHKLLKHRPKTISQASRIPGVSPADISVLLVYFGR
ncbi:tRNA uridine 5-carboxymethylaminomethyl modification enzyme MnmG [bioreactor metagenome]|uniref:tRNA uridine 5-carboxymethylaminomethyl modification enzyme MnmG n=1 Tax=bioreactor metagenome TaxID=1076179 RepID=A0A644WNM0_9ZZZZ|nr:tRNA uridine-5-carboxymethylaminomethyl(34) synthesis enzyme MnmG [Rikenellaceae bacterium]